MNQEFKQAYSRLNPAQKQAVDQIDGPVLVIAGPGTGKTQLLSVRVANILTKTDTDPGSVLCLTFTNFAAGNMRRRLGELVGPSANNVMVRTFHSFAAEIMQLYPEFFWNGAKLSIVPDALQLEIIQSILRELPLDNPLALKFADNFTAINDIKEALRLVKEAGLTPDKLQALIQVNQAYIDIIEPNLADILSDKLSLKKLDDLVSKVEALPDQPIDSAVAPITSLSSVIKNGLGQATTVDKTIGKTTNTGKWKRGWIQNVGGQAGMYEERRRNAWWTALSGVYKKYRQRLHAKGYYDYSDMIIEVISVLEQKPDLLALVQEKFLYVLIDEFQDANTAQLRLAHLVASHASNENKPNLMAVGDDDQTIFAFNGAELNNMLNFTSSYPAAKLVVLSDNYRSNADILKTSASIINQADDRLINRLSGLNKDLRAATKQSKGDIKHLSYPTKEHQLSLLAEDIKTTWNADKAQTIAVLARSNGSLRSMSYYLHQAGVNIAYEQQNDVLDQSLIQQVEILAELILAISEGDTARTNQGLRLLLVYPAWQIKPLELWRLATNNFGVKASWLDAMLEAKDPALTTIANWLIDLAHQSSHEPLAVMIEYMIGLRSGKHLTSPLRRHYLDLRPLDNQYLEGLSALSTLQQLTQEFSQASSTKPKLEDLVRFLGISRDSRRPIVDQSWFITSDQAVQLMTVHKAKGLEFDVVYLIDAVDKDWQPKRIGRRPPANLPLQSYGEHFDDYARLAYVAATRSRKSFIVSSYKIDQKGQPVAASPLFSSLKVVENEQVAEPDQVKLLEQGLSWPRLEGSDVKSLLKPRLANYKLSATGLLRFLDVTNGGPKLFLQRELLRLPELTTAQMAYGTAIHSALQLAQNLINSGSFDVHKITSAFSEKLDSLQLTQDSLERYLPHGQRIIENLFASDNFVLSEGGQAEVTISELHFGDAILNGTLDLVQTQDGDLIITDYKTGKSLSDFGTRDQTKVIKAWRQKTQLLFYCLMAGASGRFSDVKKISAQIVYVEAEEPKQLILRLDPSQAELERLGKLIGAVWRKIQRLDFDDTTAYPTTIDGIRAFEEALLKGK